MCGRYNLVTPEEALRNLFSVDDSLPTLSPRYNIAPTQDAPVIISTGDDRRSMVMMRWGLVPSWSPRGPDKRFSMFNARAETVSTKSAFRLAFRHRPCLVPVDGFYEWKKEKIGKTPHHLSMIDNTTFALAGLWESWRSNTDSTLHSFTIITTTANSLMSEIHARMPVIIPIESHQEWLSGDTPREQLLVPYPSSYMQTKVIGSYINKTSHDDPMCLTPVEHIDDDNRLI